MKAKYAAQIRLAIVRAKNEARGVHMRPPLSTTLEFDAFYAYTRRHPLPECRHRCPACRMGLVTHLLCDPQCRVANPEPFMQRMLRQSDDAAEAKWGSRPNGTVRNPQDLKPQDYETGTSS